MKRMLMSVVASLAALSLQAVDAVWTNTATDVKLWTTAVNWTNAATGAVLTQPPTAAGDAATFPYVDQRLRTVAFCGDVADGSFSVASVSGARQWCLQLPTRTYVWNTTHHTFGFDDVNGFKGTWRAVGPQRTLAFNAASGVQTLETLSANDRIVLDVRNADVEAKVSVVSEAGAIEKKGAGQLTLGLMQHPDQNVYLNEGKLVLEGVPTDLGALFARAAVHLDASRADTMTGYTGDDGRHYVTNWSHASGGRISAELWDNSGDTIATHVKKPHAPFVNSNDVASTGLPLMDFGSNSPNTVDRLGPTNCTLRLSKSLTNVREVFYIDMHTEGQAPSNYTLCTSANADSVIFSGNADYAFKFYDSFPAMKDGVVAFNGVEKFPVWASSKLQIARPKDVYSPTWDSLTLTSVALAQNIEVEHLCCGSLYATQCGGMRVAEVLIYTNALTQAERRQINAYLLRKWFAQARADASVLHVADDATVSVAVPSGSVARVDNVVLAGKTLVKEGDGTLVIGAIEPRDATVSVKGGSVKVSSTGAEITTAAPAGTPYFWWDGDADRFVTNETGGVTGWKDHRSELSRQAYVPSGKAAATKENVSIHGVSHTVVAVPDGSYLATPYRKENKDVCCMKEYFVVARFDSDAYAQARVAVGMEKIRRNARGSSDFLAADSCDEDWGGSVATVNGVAVDPFGSSVTWAGGSWYVLSLSSNGTGAGAVLRLAGTYASSEVNGGVAIGEMLAYDTALTPEERRNTVAYLMKKWLGKDHPDAEDRGTPTYAYEATEPVRIATDDDVAVRGYTGGNGTIVKEGVGKATLADYVSSFTALSVAGGELALTRSGFADRSAYHFDASDASTFDAYYVDANGTNVERVVDVRRNGKTAQRLSSDYLFTTNPVIRHVETRAGVTRPVFDFLNYRDRAGSLANLDCAGFSTTDMAVGEVHEIYSDANSAKAAFTFGAASGTPYHRSGQTGPWIHASSSAAAVRAGYLAVDGTPVPCSYNISGAFHLLSSVPTNSVKLGRIGCERVDRAGGCYIGEMLAFETPLTAVERTYVQQSLMYKWFENVPFPEWTNEVASVAVAAGAKMTFAPGSVIVTPKLSGSGEIEAVAVRGVAELELETANGRPVPKTVTGGVSLAAAVTLRLADGLRRLPEGEYPLLTADGTIEGAESAQWTIMSDATERRFLRVASDGNVLKLLVQRKGLLVIVR